MLPPARRPPERAPLPARFQALAALAAPPCLLLAALAACGPAPEALAPPSASSSEAPRPSTPRPSPPPSPATVPHRFRPVARFGEAHHAPREGSLELLASELAAPPYPRLGPAAELPEGAMVAARVFPWKGDEPGPSTPRGGASAILLMRKRSPGFFPAGHDWEFFELSPDGEVRRGGRLGTCARCHAEAPHGGLFGPPRPP